MNLNLWVAIREYIQAELNLAADRTFCRDPDALPAKELEKAKWVAQRRVLEEASTRCETTVRTLISNLDQNRYGYGYAGYAGYAGRGGVTPQGFPSGAAGAPMPWPGYSGSPEGSHPDQGPGHPPGGR